MKRYLTPVAYGSLISLLFLIIFLNKLIININQPFGTHGDIQSTIFVLNNGYEKLSSWDFNHLYESRMLYPHKNNLASGNAMLIPSLLGLPVYLLTKSAVSAFNFTILTNFLFSFLSMYLLAYFFTKNKAASVAGLIYTYNPFMMAQLFHPELTMLFWLPLIFLISELVIKKIRLSLLLILVLLFLLQLLSSVYYAFFLVLIWPIYMAFRLKSTNYKWRQLANPKILIALVLIVFSTYLIIKPYQDFQKDNSITPDLEYTTSLSARPTDYLFTTPENRLYGWAADSGFFKQLRDQNSIKHYSEHSLFPGFISMGLLLLALWLLLKKKTTGASRGIIISYLVILTVGLILSLGPYLDLGNLHLPMPYLLLYKFAPFVSGLRAVSRFSVLVFLSLAILASFTATKMKNYLIILVLILISLEYLTKISEPIPIDPKILSFYSWLESQKAKVIVELPIANVLPNQELNRPYAEDAQYLFYGTYHHKFIVNGYNSYIPQDLVELGNKLTINFPTTPKIELLRKLGVDTIVVHREEYLDPQRANLLIINLQKNLKKIYSSDTVNAFSIVQ